MEEYKDQDSRFNIQVPVKPDRNLKMVTNENSNRAVTVTLIVILLGIIAFTLVGNYVMLTFRINFIITVILFILAFAFIDIIAVSAFVYKGTQRITERSAFGGNKSILRSTIWNLSNNPTQEELDLDIPVKALVIKYGSAKGLVLGITNGCLEAYDDNMKITYYHLRQQLIDTLIKRQFKCCIIEKKFNVDDDKIWNYYRNQIYEACKRYENAGFNTQNYRRHMNASLDSLYQTAYNNSKVATNYIIMTKPNITIEQLSAIVRNIKFPCSSIYPAQMGEINNLFMSYYGDESLQITNEIPMSTKEQSPGCIEYIGYIDVNGKFHASEQVPTIRFPQEYLTHSAPVKRKEIDKNKHKHGDASIFTQEI